MVDPRTGEVLAPANAELTKELQLKLEKAKVKKVEVIVIPKQDNFASVRKTLEKDSVRGEEEALLEIYRKLRPGDPPTLDSARNLWDNLFFNARRYDLAKVGRYKLNKKLKLDVPLATRVLTKEDLVEVDEVPAAAEQRPRRQGRHRSPGQPPRALAPASSWRTSSASGWSGLKRP